MGALHLIRDGIVGDLAELVSLEWNGSALIQGSVAVRIEDPESRAAVAAAVVALGPRPWLATFDASGAVASAETSPSNAAFRLRSRLETLARQLGGGSLDLADASEFERALVHCDLDLLRHLRDRAQILLAYHLACGNAQWSLLRRSDLTRVESGWEVTLPRANNDPYGRTVNLMLRARRDPAVCPVEALDVWLAAAALGPDDYLFPPIVKGRIKTDRPFAQGSAVHQLRRLCSRAGTRQLTLGSFPRGFIEEAARAGATDVQVRAVTRHGTAAWLCRHIAEIRKAELVRTVATEARSR